MNSVKSKGPSTEPYEQVMGRNDDQKQNEQGELAAIKERHRNMKEMTEKIEQENKELKRLTKRLVKARKRRKN
jgi:hypothetical protein